MPLQMYLEYVKDNFARKVAQPPEKEMLMKGFSVSSEISDSPVEVDSGFNDGYYHEHDKGDYTTYGQVKCKAKGALDW